MYLCDGCSIRNKPHSCLWVLNNDIFIQKIIASSGFAPLNHFNSDVTPHLFPLSAGLMFLLLGRFVAQTGESAWMINGGESRIRRERIFWKILGQPLYAATLYQHYTCALWHRPPSPLLACMLLISHDPPKWLSLSALFLLLISQKIETIAATAPQYFFPD